MSTHDGTHELKSLLDGVLGRRGLGRRHREVEAARSAWAAAAGPELSAHTRVRGLRSGVLTVDVDSAPLCHRLAAFDRERLLAGTQERARSVWIAELRFRLGAFPHGGRDS